MNGLEPKLSALPKPITYKGKTHPTRFLIPPSQTTCFIYLDISSPTGKFLPVHKGLSPPSCFLCLLSTSISTAPITFLPHPLILWRKKTHQNNYFMSPNMQIIFFNERCLTSPIQLICKCRQGFICDILSG